MKVTIEGELDQITDTLSQSAMKRPRATKGDSAVAKANNVVAQQRAVLRQAFELVRYDPLEKQLAENILAAMVGRAPRTEAIMETAQLLIDARS